MQVINMQLTHKEYNIYIQDGLLAQVGTMLTELYPQSRFMIVTDEHVASYYLDKLLAQLPNSDHIVLPAGERSKSLDSASTIYAHLSASNFSRSDVLIALGGGVIGDLTGFVAATYLRGIPFVQIPTSLLAQVDSSIGGKVAVDITAGKNLVGAFYQPAAVYIDPEVLRTLEARFFYDGLAEVIKYACIKDADLFELLSGLHTREEIQKVATTIILACLQIKKEYVEQDEFDTGVRMFLNFGHTIGHALEKHYGFERYTHGEAVAIGMQHLTNATEKMGLTQAGTAAQLRNLLEQYCLPTNILCKDEEFMESLLSAIAVDKKNLHKKLNLVVLEQIGASFIHRIEPQTMREYLRGGCI